MRQTIFFFYSVAQLYWDATVVRRKPVVPHWDRSGIHLLSTLLFTRIHESSIRIKWIKPGTHTATRSQLQLKRPSSFLAAYYTQVTLDKFWNPQIPQPTTYNHSLLMHERQSFSKHDIERGAIWVGRAAVLSRRRSVLLLLKCVQVCFDGVSRKDILRRAVSMGLAGIRV